MSSPILTMLLTQGPSKLTLESWTTLLITMGVPLKSTPQSGEKEGVFTAELENGTVLGLIHVPKPIPGDDLDYFRSPSLQFPPGAEGIDPHDGHVLLTALGSSDALDRRFDLTLVTVAVADAIGAMAIYWPDVPQLTTVEFAKMALNGEEVPAPLWTAVDLARDGDRMAALTRGLTTFGHPDLWLTSAEMEPFDLHMYAFSIISYVISGAKLEPGQTIGVSEDERLPITAATSPRGDEVVRIDLA